MILLIKIKRLQPLFQCNFIVDFLIKFKHKWANKIKTIVWLLTSLVNNIN